jgi:hypothetical protein
MTTPPGTSRRSWDRARTAASLAVVLVSFAATAASLLTRSQLGTMGAFQSTWMALGLSVAETGTVGAAGVPSVYKPPGYPAFIGGLVATMAGTPERCAGECPTSAHWGHLDYPSAWLERAAALIYWGQACAHALSAGALFVGLARLLALGPALLGGLLYGLNPLLIVLVGSTHYSVLHLFFIVWGCLLLWLCLGPPPRGALAWGLAGAWWGLATLVRPVSLILPPFVLAAACVQRGTSPRRALAQTGWLTLGLCLVVVPYGVRNHRLTGRFIPVNAQLWVAVFGATARDIPASAERMRWKGVLADSREVAAVAVNHRVAGVFEPLAIGLNLRLEAAYRRAALANLRRQPFVYLRNVARSLWSYSTQTTSVYLRIFKHYQAPGGTWPRFGRPGTAGDPASWPGGDASLALGRVLGLAALFGAAWGAWTRDRLMAVPAALHLCLAAAHAITWMDFTYLYLTLPFLCLFAAYAVDRVVSAPGGRVLPRVGLALSTALAMLLAMSLAETFLA